MTLTGVILVGGESTSSAFRPLSMGIPPSLLQISGESILSRHIHALSAVKGLTRVFLIGFYESRAFLPFCEDMRARYPGLDVQYLFESESMGSAGAMALFAPDIAAEGVTEVITMASDVIMNPFPLSDLVDFHRKHGKKATVLGARVPKETATRYGAVVQSQDDPSIVQHFVEKPHTFLSDLANGGVYVLNVSVFDVIRGSTETPRTPAPSHHARYHLDPGHAKGYSNMEVDVVPLLTATRSMAVYEVGLGLWAQLKSAAMLLRATALFPSSTVYIHPTAVVDPTAKLGPFVSVGANAIIGAGCRVSHAIVMDSCHLKDNSFVSEAILAAHCVVGAWARVEGVKDKDLVRFSAMRAGNVAVLGKNVKVHSEVMIRGCVVLPNVTISHSINNEIIL